MLRLFTLKIEMHILNNTTNVSFCLCGNEDRCLSSVKGSQAASFVSQLSAAAGAKGHLHLYTPAPAVVEDVSPPPYSHFINQSEYIEWIFFPQMFIKEPTKMTLLVILSIHVHRFLSSLWQTFCSYDTYSWFLVSVVQCVSMQRKAKGLNISRSINCYKIIYTDVDTFHNFFSH